MNPELKFIRDEIKNMDARIQMQMDEIGLGMLLKKSGPDGEEFFSNKQNVEINWTKMNNTPNKELKEILSKKNEVLKKFEEFYKVWNEAEEVKWYIAYEVVSKEIKINLMTKGDKDYSEKNEGIEWIEKIYKILNELGFENQTEQIKLKSVFSREEANSDLNDLIFDELDDEMISCTEELEDFFAIKINQILLDSQAEIHKLNKQLKLVKGIY